MTSQEIKNERSKKICRHNEMGRMKKPLRERDKADGKYEVPHEIKHEGNQTGTKNKKWSLRKTYSIVE